MPREVIFENNRQGALISLTGSLTGDELKWGTEDIYIRDTTRRLRYQILDLTGVDSINLSLADLEQTAEIDRSKTQGDETMIIAIVVHNPVLQSLCEAWMHFAKSEQLKTNLFSSQEEARAWAHSLIEDDTH